MSKQYREYYSKYRALMREFSEGESESWHREFVLQNKDFVANEFGESIKETLGSGAYGTAFLLHSGKVLKLSSSLFEATAALRLMKRRKLQHIVSYYDVRLVIGQQGDIRYFALILDGVTPLTDSQKELYNTLRASGWHKQSVTDSTVIENFKRWIDLRNEEDVSNDTLIKYLMSNRSAILQEWKKYSIDEYEAHVDNVGFDQFGQFVVYDIATSGIDSEAPNAPIEKRSMHDLQNKLRHIIIPNTQYDATGITNKDEYMKNENFYSKWRRYLQEQQRVQLNTKSIGPEAILRYNQNTDYKSIQVSNKTPGSFTFIFTGPIPTDISTFIVTIPNLEFGNIIPKNISANINNGKLVAKIPAGNWRKSSNNKVETIFELQNVSISSSSKLSFYLIIQTTT
jgi:hypothetical protein